MFRCPTCHKEVVVAACPECRTTENDADFALKGFIEFLRTGRYVRPEPAPPQPFRQRLAAFVGCDESDVMRHHPKQSSMPLRIFAPIGPYIGAKATWFIRWVLNRIHRAVSAR